MPGLFNYEDPSAEVFEDRYAILSDLDDSEWDVLIGFMERKLFPAGARILQAGERDRALYLVVTGTVKVVVESSKGPIHVASITEGSVFGEMAFFDGEPRSAHVFALDRVEVLSLRAERLEQLVAWHPRIAHKLLMELGRVLSQRLRRFYRE
ncbi:MAG: cyclic nucleotide-binding domain-containing protein [Acetobacteraceae bacterium]